MWFQLHIVITIFVADIKKKEKEKNYCSRNKKRKRKKVYCSRNLAVTISYPSGILHLVRKYERKSFKSAKDTAKSQKQPLADWQMLFKIHVLKNFAIFTGKRVLGSLFNKAASLNACYFIKKRLQHRCFLVNIMKFLLTFFFYKTSLVAASKKVDFGHF